jgi:DNA-directed RNA polymerase subunit M/transcription elongation factor TFIIS
MKRVLRYIRGTASLVFCLEHDENANEEIVATTDSSWASDEKARSTSGGVVRVQGWVIQHWSRTQPTVAQSSCEAELLALNGGATEAKFAQSVLSEMGKSYVIKMQSDSSSAIATTAKRGLGRLRHLAVKELWLQDEVRSGKVVIEYLPTEINVADMLTKGMPTKRYAMLKQMIGLRQMDDMEIEKPLSEPMINVIEEYEAPLCARCSRIHEYWIFMQLQVNDESGMAYWECGSCSRILTWSEYNGTAPLPHDDSFRSTARSSGTAMRAPATETRMNSNLPTPEQVEYLAHLAFRAGEDMDSLMMHVQTRAHASQEIARLRHLLR